MDYYEFLQRKTQLDGDSGFEPVWIPDFLYDFQRVLLKWSCRKGRSAIFADCGLGKTPIQLAWADNVVRYTNGRVLVLTPLAVAGQTEKEAKKFGIDAKVSRNGTLGPTKIIITNYERLHYFTASDFIGCICDESSILKNFNGVTKAAITEFMRLIPYRLLCTATAAPNDYIELGTSSEALGYLTRQHMLAQFFTHDGSDTAKWRLKGHARSDLFWRWMCSWSRALRRPSDLGFSDGLFELPPLIVRDHVVATIPGDGLLFAVPAVGLAEQRAERRSTIEARCELAAAMVSTTTEPAVCWCHLNDEGNLLERLIPGAVQVAGKDTDERKEEVLEAFSTGKIRVLVTKPTIAGWGLNWQHCAHQTFFPSHSFEQWYQAIRRSWRFGQTHQVIIDVITSEGEADVMANMERKQHQADAMFENIVGRMSRLCETQKVEKASRKVMVPSWL